MRASLKLVTTALLLLPIFSAAKISRKPLSEPAKVKNLKDAKTNSLGNLEGVNYNLEVDVLKAPEVTQVQKNFFIAMSYSLFSPTFDSDVLKSQNQESLGVSALFGYSYLPYSGWGLQGSLGILQHSKTDRSLPDFTLFKPSVSILFALTKSIYVTGGIFTYIQQGESVKNFQSYAGQEVFVGYKANKKINIKFGFSNSKFSGDFESAGNKVNSLVFIRSLESQLVYLF